MRACQSVMFLSVPELNDHIPIAKLYLRSSEVYIELCECTSIIMHTGFSRSCSTSSAQLPSLSEALEATTVTVTPTSTQSVSPHTLYNTSPLHIMRTIVCVCACPFHQGGSKLNFIGQAILIHTHSTPLSATPLAST